MSHMNTNTSPHGTQTALNVHSLQQLCWWRTKQNLASKLSHPVLCVRVAGECAAQDEMVIQVSTLYNCTHLLSHLGDFSFKFYIFLIRRKERGVCVGEIEGGEESEQ